MNMKRVLGFALLIVGALLLWFGLQSTDSLGEKIVEGVTGRYTDSTMAYLICGSFAGIAGLGLLTFGGKRR